jgi:serine/threonine protein kinase
MGVVLEAEHQRLKQSVAIKVVSPELARDGDFLVRFEREARAAARLKSPHVVRTFDVDTTPEGLTYMVMELLDGNDLAEELELRAPLDRKTAVGWIVECCAALEEAHALGVVHRDIKPANVFLAWEGERRVAKLVDFGISRLEGETTTKPGGKTEGALGTPRYMSPEQLRSGRTVDHRSDIWSLGVVLYRVLASRSPFSGADDAAYTLSVIADSPAPLEEVAPEVPAGLARAVMRALEKDPDDRFQSAAEMADALRAFGPQPEVAEVEPPPSRGRVIAAVVIGAGALALAIYLALRPGAPPAPPPAASTPPATAPATTIASSAAPEILPAPPPSTAAKIERPVARPVRAPVSAPSIAPSAAPPPDAPLPPHL